MKIGRKIYYEIATGNVILDTGERQGSVVLTSLEQDIQTYKALSERNRESFDVIELPFGAYRQDFAESNGYRVNPETKELEFSYPDPNEPEEPQPYIIPLSQEISIVKDRLSETDTLLLEFMETTLLGGM